MCPVPEGVRGNDGPLYRPSSSCVHLLVCAWMPVVFSHPVSVAACVFRLPFSARPGTLCSGPGPSTDTVTAASCSHSASLEVSSPVASAWIMSRLEQRNQKIIIIDFARRSGARTCRPAPLPAPLPTSSPTLRRTLGGAIAPSAAPADPLGLRGPANRDGESSSSISCRAQAGEKTSCSSTNSTTSRRGGPVNKRSPFLEYPGYSTTISTNGYLEVLLWKNK